MIWKSYYQKGSFHYDYETLDFFLKNFHFYVHKT